MLGPPVSAGVERTSSSANQRRRLPCAIPRRRPDSKAGEAESASRPAYRSANRRLGRSDPLLVVECSAVRYVFRAETHTHRPTCRRSNSPFRVSRRWCTSARTSTHRDIFTSTDLQWRRFRSCWCHPFEPPPLRYLRDVLQTLDRSGMLNKNPYVRRTPLRTISDAQRWSSPARKRAKPAVASRVQAAGEAPLCYPCEAAL